MKKNPEGNWSYTGKYSIFLTEDADLTRIPPGVHVGGRTVRVKDGKMQRVGGKYTNFFASGLLEAFGWNDDFVIDIRDGNSKIIWYNEKYW